MQTEDTGTNMNPDINIEVARLRAENSQLQKELTKSESERLQIEDINGWIDSEFQIANKRALQAEAEVARLREAIKPFLRFANGIPDNWPEQCILRFDQRIDGSLNISYYGVQDASDGITIKQWRELARLASAPEEPVIQDSRITEPVSECKRCKGRGTVWSSAVEPAGGLAICPECETQDGATMDDEDWNLKPKQEEMPLEKELDYLTREASRASDIHNHVLIVDCLRYLRDEIQKLKDKNTND